MAGKNNLVPLQQRSAADRKRIASMGGKASSRQQAGRRLLRETLDQLLSEGNTQEEICKAQLRKAQRGDTKSFLAVAQLLGESTQRLEVARVDAGAREQFIRENKDLLIQIIEREAKTGERGLSEALALSYEERKLLILGAAEQRNNNGKALSAISTENGSEVIDAPACEIGEE